MPHSLFLSNTGFFGKEGAKLISLQELYSVEEKVSNRKRLPSWLRMQKPTGEAYSRVKNLVEKNQLHTICVSGNCPNIGECWSRGTATFMILGNTCTRSCKFCGVATGKPGPVDPDEPMRVARAVKTMGVKHCVITSVDRDDLPDGGASFWAEVIREVKQVNPETTIEVLIPDFMGRKEDILQVVEAGPEVISHNLETVKRLTPQIRSVARYERSLEVISLLSASGVVSKSGIMLGLGETEEEVLATMDDLRAAGCKVFTLGQYLAPGMQHLPVSEYIAPEKFEEYRIIALQKGFDFVESSPLVRSSYCAEKHVNSGQKIQLCRE
jgi:lipoic acid synthetase